MYGQTTEFPGKVDLGPTAHVYKVVTIPNCPQTYTPPAGATPTTIKHETKLTNGKTEITIESVVNSAGVPIIVNANKELKIPFSPNSDGKASIYVDDKDKSILYVNYWLNKRNEVAPGTTIQECYPVYTCAGVPTMTLRVTRVLANSETFYYRRVEATPGNPELTTLWFLNSEQIRVLNPTGGIAYYLVNRYDRGAKYILELQNREYIAYNSKSLHLGALTIPFKYRFGFKKNGIDIKDDVTASFNIGVYGGYKLTRYSIINKAGTYTNKTSFSFRVGPFINLSSAALDSVSTTVGKVPMKKDEKQNIAVLSTGVGIMGDIRGVQMGVYGGWDFGMGSEADNWNYHKRFWLGVGVGFKITDLFAQKE
jgi:hypothetical protein